MRVLKSILLVLGVGADPTQPLEKNKDLKRGDPYNRLVTINKMVNRFTVMSKGGSPDRCDEDSCDYGLDNKKRNKIEGITNAIEFNNKFFNNNLVRNYERLDKSGELKCAIHDSKSARAQQRQRRDAGSSSLALDQEDWENFCWMLDMAHDEDDGPCEDCCTKDEHGNYPTVIYDDEGNPIFIARGLKQGLETEPQKGEEHHDSYMKNARKLYSVLKKWAELYIGDCKGQKQRYTRIINMMANRLYNGIVHDFTSFDVVKDARWKRVLPKDYPELTKQLIFDRIEQKLSQN